MKRSISALLAACVALSACAGPMPPAPPVPPAPTVSGYGAVPPRTSSVFGTAGAAQRLIMGMDVPGEWWTLFHSPELNALINQALAENPDIAAAQAALRSARETFLAQRASAYPNVQGSFSVSRQQAPPFFSPPLNSNAYTYAVHTASVDIAYAPDAFGNVRYQTASAGAAAQAQRFQTEETYLTLTSNVVVIAVQIASLRGQIDANNRIVAINKQQLKLVTAQRRYGQATDLDVATQEAALRTAEQTIPSLEKQLLQSRNLLARLVGRPPSEAPAAAFDLASLRLPEKLPLSLPSQLIVQRPDIAATSANLAQASAEVGVAHTNRLPNFSITAGTATQALTLGGLFGAGSFFSDITGQVATTFYDHGALKHREKAAVAVYDEAVAQYKGAVLSGLQNVADSLAAISTDADALRAATRADRAARHGLEIVRSQQRFGQVSTLAVLNAEQTYQQAELSLIQAQANRFSDSAGLFAALGGGWWKRSETAAQ